MIQTSVREVRTFAGLQELSEAATEEIVSIARECIASRGRFSIALSGGGTPKRTYQLLGERHASDVDWSRWDVVFGDERFVPIDDTRSNYRMAKETLLVGAPIPASQVYPVPTNAATVGDAADAYEQMLKRLLKADPTDRATIDLVLLGVGPDGHTASLFPGSPALDERIRWTRAVDAPTTVQPAVPRVTVTLPFLNGARHVLFLVAGADKRAVIGEILDGTESGRRYPAAMVASAGRTLWMIERSAMPAGQSNT
jgi:6-phosphogluconolactonase